MFLFVGSWFWVGFGVWALFLGVFGILFRSSAGVLCTSPSLSLYFPWKQELLSNFHEKCLEPQYFFLCHDNPGLCSATALTAHYFKIIGWADKIQITLLILGRGALSTLQCCSIDSSKRGSSVLFPLNASTNYPTSVWKWDFFRTFLFILKWVYIKCETRLSWAFFLVPITSGSTVLQHWQL